MQDRHSQYSSSSQLSTGTQFGTQNSGNKVSIDTFVDKFIEHGKKLASKRKSGQEETFVANIKVVVRQVADERRQGRVFNFLRSTVGKDKAAKLTDFYSSWCQLTSLLDEEDRVSCRIAGLRLALEVLSTKPVICLYVSTLYDEFVKQIQLCDSEQILPLLETHSGSLAVPSLSNRSLSMDDIIEKYLDERALEDLLDVEQRPAVTSKCVNLLRVLNNKRLLRVLREVILAWLKKRGVAPVVGLMSCVHEMAKVARDHQNSEPGLVMCSEFGFLLAFALCKIDRYKTSMLLELTKTFQKLWTFRENVHEFGWIENSGLGEVVDIVEDQGNLLDLRHANTVVPILMLIFRSFSKQPKVIAGSQLSQSFATFSSQSLQAMGCKRKTDETVCLEVIGLLKRCLTQWTPTKTAVYLGFAEEGKRNSPMAGQCLDFLVSHAATAPEWKAETMCLTAGGVVTLVEPLPHLIQAIQCLLSEEVVADVAPVKTQIGVNVQKNANDLIDSWVLKASNEDVHDLGVDKLSEWNPATARGCANMLFAHMMLNVYDVLIEHEWSRFHENQRESSSIEALNELRSDLLDWAIDRMLSLSKSLLHGFHPLHSVFCGTSTLTYSAGFLLDYYTSTNCADWIESRELADPSKTRALEAYANILLYLSAKYRSQPIKVIPIWKRSDLNATLARGDEKTLTTNGSLVRHCHLFVTKLLPAILAVDRREGEERRRISVELERQAKLIFKICSALMKMMDSPRCFMTMFKFTMGMLEKNVIANNFTLRELLKWLCNLTMKCMDSDNEVEKTLNTVADNLVQVLSEEECFAQGDECKYKFVEHASKATICDFLASLIDRSLMLNNVKTVPEMVEWKSLTLLSKLLKERLQAIMAIADEHVGIFNPEEARSSRKKSVRKDEIIYVKYVRAREALQSRILLISEALKEDRLNFQVKKNTIGMRDFRINLKALKTRVVQNEDEEPRRKKIKATKMMGRSDEQENEESLKNSDEEDGITVGDEYDASEQSVIY
ncbi:unnamed protein product [Angiostrongylus costaricensis]|uniref:FANCI_HD2 domain-containing protein n=1 Tax=Angiostrongylus costaricensis TaxID=334426 RepID=A0A158PM98_ANGCS|nr:unnamed protein product [Angiostrongylus costaricensis]